MADYSTVLEITEQFLATLPIYPCLCVVHPDIQQLQSVGKVLVNRYGWGQIAVNTRLSQMLLDVAPRRRPAIAPKVFGDILQAFAPGPVLCQEIELLFEPTLKLDPLRLFRDQSRHTTTAVLWPGSYVDGILTYAVPEHAHYQTWVRPELCDYCIISL